MKTALTTHQQEVYEAIISDIKQNLSSIIRSSDIEDHFLSLTGPAGVGKSHITVQILKGLMGLGNICVTAPTNKAVKVLKDMIDSSAVFNADVRTIHSFLNIRPVKDYNTGEEKFSVLRTKRNLPQASLLIVDESSMVSDDLYSFIVEAFNRGQVNTVLFVGDPYQLLPINQGENVVFKLKRQYLLTEIVRQAKESNIIKLATQIRKRIETQNFINFSELLAGNETEDIAFFEDKKRFLKDFYKNENWYNEDKILTSFTNKDIDSFNQHIRDHYWGEHGIRDAAHFVAGDMIRFKSTFEHRPIAWAYSPPLFQNGDEVQIASARLVQREGASIKYWECTAVGRKETEIFRVIDQDSLTQFNQQLNLYVQFAKTADYRYKKRYWGQYFRLKNAFADIQYIHAATIHKLQGSTYDTVYIDISTLINNEKVSNDFKYRLLYVAITRARSKVNIFY